MNRVSRNVDLQSSPYFFHYQKCSQGPFQVYHAHKGMEFMFVHEGAGRVCLEQEKSDVFPGTLLCYMPFHLHKLVMDPHIPFVRTILIFDPSILEPYLRLFPLLHSLFMQLSENPTFPHIIGPLPDLRPLNDVLGDFHALTKESLPEHQPEHFAAFMVGFLQRLQSLVPRDWEMPLQKTSSMASHHAGKIIQWIDEHYSEDFSLAQLSKELHLSPYYLSHLFRDAAGESISAYLTHRRIREICLLLKTSSLSLQDIGRRVGLPNIPHLCTIFKKTMNMTPIQYRKMFEQHMIDGPEH
ncbi:AraC family transcriptional regulator [Paenibacillus sp. RC67]|uniref:helix-turn-helix transcriptional regulator n=1 Tax=Paenibacillus sp. RC67 TaxID=3039392 RepID=UPI0024AD591F|nr:AraC family transcriptional regulator [Paenibacillus sp. RC67]